MRLVQYRDADGARKVGLVTEAKPGGFGGVDAGRLAVAAGLTLTEVAA